jgi:hypothetical protein
MTGNRFSAVVAAIGMAQASSRAATLAPGWVWCAGRNRRRSHDHRQDLQARQEYLRTLFVQAAHVILARRPSAAMRGLWPWIAQASKRLHRDMLAIALANKLARIAWAVLARGHEYQPRIMPHAA